MEEGYVSLETGAVKIGVTTFACDAKSGVRRYVTSLLQEFERQACGDQFEIVLYKDEELDYQVDERCTNVVRVSRWLRNPVANVAWHQIVLPVLCARRQIDVLFVPAASRRLPVWVPCSLVGTVHDLTPFHVEGKYDPLRMVYQTRVLPQLLKRLDHVIAVSDSTRRDVVERVGVPDGRMSVIHHGADNDAFHPGDSDEAAEHVHKYGVRPPYMLYTSRIEHPGKNHVRLIHAFEKFKLRDKFPHQLVLAGADWTGARKVHEAAATSAVARDIIFAGYVPEADLPALYRGAELMVFPSLYEGFGLPILEAMASGTPVACSNRSSMPEIGGDAVALFDPFSTASMTTSMHTVLTSSVLRNSLSRKGIERAREFSWKRAAAETLEVIRRTALRR